MNINFYRLNKTKNCLWIKINAQIDEDAFLNDIASKISGNIDILQLENEFLTTKIFVEIAKKIKLLCAEFGVLFIMVKRCDVALCVDADGIFLEDEGLDVHFVRHLLGEQKIIGVENTENVSNDADYYVLLPNQKALNEKITFEQKEIKLFQGSSQVFLCRAYL